MDLHTPPPSYEVAIGACGTQNEKNPYFNSPLPPAYGDNISTTSLTAPILPQPQRSSSSTSNVCTERRARSQQTNNILGRSKPKSDCNLFVCIYVLITIIVILGVIVYFVRRSNNLEYMINYSVGNIKTTTELTIELFEGHSIPVSDGERRINTHHDEISRRLDLDELKWDFPTTRRKRFDIV